MKLVDMKEVKPSTHPRIIDSNIYLTTKVAYFSNFVYGLSLKECNDPRMQTAGVTVTGKGPQMIYSKAFFDKLDDAECAFVLIHEVSHLLLSHPSRGRHLDRDLANIAMDMIINSTIIKFYNRIVSIESVYLKHLGMPGVLKIPDDYKGQPLMEELYEWLQKQRDCFKKDPNSVKDPVLKKLFESGSEEGSGFDIHFSDDVPESVRKAMIEEIKDRLRNRGLVKGEIESMLGDLVKTKKDYLALLKRVWGVLSGMNKDRSYRRPHRKGLEGVKGMEKNDSVYNFILDVSGSMSGYFEKALSVIYRDTASGWLIQNDAEVQKVDQIRSKKDIRRLKIKGLGGTALQPGVDYIRDKLNTNATVILTDGYTDSLDLSGLKKPVLIISVDKPVPIANPGRIVVKQVTITKEEQDAK